jgi:hypothetical protein
MGWKRKFDIAEIRKGNHGTISKHCHKINENYNNQKSFLPHTQKSTI